MGFDISLPNITAPTEAGRIEQIKGYIYQLAEQLKWALNSIEETSSKVVLQQDNTSQSKGITETESQATFNSIKSLIIKSADIVNAYYEELNERLEGIYVAESDFGTYKEETALDIEANSKEITQLYDNLQSIESDIKKLEHNLVEANAYIKSGELYTDDQGVPIYGIEIGQRNKIDGVEVFNKYARFISDRLSFYDQNDNEVAYISDYKLYITNAEITGKLKLGAFEIDTANGLTLKYVGRG